jgi:hypothetical protein
MEPRKAVTVSQPCMITNAPYPKLLPTMASTTVTTDSLRSPQVAESLTITRDKVTESKTSAAAITSPLATTDRRQRQHEHWQHCPHEADSRNVREANNSASHHREHWVRNDDIIAQLLVMQHRMASAIHLPCPAVPVFSGDPLEYTTFMKAFDMRVASHVENEADKLFYLDQQLRGEPKELIGGCLLMDSNDGYKHARYLLEKEYGDHYKIAIGYLDKLRYWPKLKNEDPHGMKRLSIYMTKCLCVMSSIKDRSILDHTPTLQCIVGLLPDELQQEWRDHVHELRKDNKNVAFRELSEFIERIAESLNHPIYGPEALQRVQGLGNHTPSSEPCQDLHVQEAPNAK